MPRFSLRTALSHAYRHAMLAHMFIQPLSFVTAAIAMPRRIYRIHIICRYFHFTCHCCRRHYYFSLLPHITFIVLFSTHVITTCHGCLMSFVNTILVICCYCWLAIYLICRLSLAIRWYHFIACLRYCCHMSIMPNGIMSALLCQPGYFVYWLLFKSIYYHFAIEPRLFVLYTLCHA